MPADGVHPSPGPARPCSVVVVTWNSAPHLQACLRAVVDQMVEGDRCIVVDNASADGSVAVAHRFPAVEVIETGANLGFAGGVNEGLAGATGDVLLLNPDAELEPGALARLRGVLADPAVGLAGPRLEGPDGQVQTTCARRLPNLRYEVLHHVFRVSTASGGIRGRLLRRWHAPYPYHRDQDVEAISGGAMLIREEVRTRLGGLEPAFRHCGEDVEYCARVAGAGWRIRYVADAVVRHVGAASSQQAPNRTTMEAFRGGRLFYRRTRGPLPALAYRVVISGVRAPLALAYGAARAATGQWSRAQLRDRVELAAAMVTFRPYRDASARARPAPARPARGPSSAR